jgi:hypothetical protein
MSTPSSQADRKYCIVTGDEITDENDSKAHVIPSALGGRLKPFLGNCLPGWKQIPR